MKKTISFNDMQKEIDDTTKIYINENTYKPKKKINTVPNCSNKMKYDTYITENINNIDTVLKFRDMEGIAYNQTKRWKYYIPFQNEFLPINYLHIGSIYEPTIYSFIQSHGKHPLSNIHCIDHNIVNNNDISFYYKNMENTSSYPQIHIYDTFSTNTFENINYKYFDIIFFNESITKSQFFTYFDTCFNKLSNNGYIIFEGYVWFSMDEKRKRIDTILSFYKNQIKYLGNDDNNLFIMKI